MCATSAASFPSNRQSIWDLDIEIEDPDLCFAGRSGHDNELMKLGRRFFCKIFCLLRKFFG